MCSLWNCSVSSGADHDSVSWLLSDLGVADQDGLGLCIVARNASTIYISPLDMEWKTKPYARYNDTVAMCRCRTSASSPSIPSPTARRRSPPLPLGWRPHLRPLHQPAQLQTLLRLKPSSCSTIFQQGNVPPFLSFFFNCLGLQMRVIPYCCYLHFTDEFGSRAGIFLSPFSLLGSSMCRATKGMP